MGVAEDTGFGSVAGVDGVMNKKVGLKPKVEIRTMLVC
jgi:hypothetical protein